VRRLLAIVAVLLLASAARSAPPLSIELRLDPDTTLPEIPVSFRFTLTNRTDAPIRVPNRVALVAHDSDGAAFVVQCLTRCSMIDLMHEPQTLAPDESTSRVQLTEGNMAWPVWFHDRRLRNPGRFELQAFFGDSIVGDLAIDEVRQRGAASNVAILTVREPSGLDADVWAAIRERDARAHAKGSFSAAEETAFAKRIVRQYPDSAYAPWFAFVAASREQESRALLRDAIARTAADPLTDWRRSWLVQWDLTAADQNRRAHPELARVHAAAAREQLELILRDSRDDELLKRAREWRQELDEQP
jgi:hypothetical protein